MKKRNPPPPPQAGHNFSLSKADLAEIEANTRAIQALEADKAEILADIGAKKALIKAKGIDMHAWAAAKKRKEMDPDDRANFDRSAAMCNAALGVSVQGDLFGEDDAGDTGGDNVTPIGGSAGGDLPTIN